MGEGRAVALWVAGTQILEPHALEYREPQQGHRVLVHLLWHQSPEGGPGHLQEPSTAQVLCATVGTAGVNSGL